MNIRTLLRLMGYLTLILVLGCTNQTPVVAPEMLDGNCVGVIRDRSGNAVEGASVLFVPEAYAPLDPDSTVTIDSTTTDEYGRFGFIVRSGGVFNLLSNNNNLHSMRSSIRVSPLAKVALTDQILKEPGAISGTVHLEGRTDHKNVIILIVGTNRYTAPNDASGKFTIENIAQGEYTLRILTTEKEYEVAETMITVTSGSANSISDILLKKQYVPVIDTVHVVYNPALMMATLSWKPLDSARIGGYNIYCNRSMNLQPVATVSSSCSTLIQDVILQPIDTFNYQIAAIMKDGSTGPFCSGKPFVKTSAITPVSVSGIQQSFPNGMEFVTVDGAGNSYIFTGGYQKPVVLHKIDSSGNTIATNELPDTMSPLWNVTVDGEGNVFAMYAVAMDTPERLVKFNPDLSFRTETMLGSPGRTALMIYGTDSVLTITQLVNNRGILSNVEVATYTGDLTMVKELPFTDSSTVNDPKSDWFAGDYLFFHNAVTYGDSMFILTNYAYGNYPSHQEVLEKIENTIKALISPKVVVFINSNTFASPGFIVDGFLDITIGPECIVTRTSTYQDQFPALLSFFTKDKQLKGRIPWDNKDGRRFFDRKGTLLIVKPENNTITINRYSVEGLFN